MPEKQWSLESEIRGRFENLKVGELEVTSDQNNYYNCIAWAMGESDAYWWPDGDGYWPHGVPRVVDIKSFSAAFATKGFRPCADAKPREGVEKVALYTKQGLPTHAAFLSPSGKWASKLGKHHDVLHETLACIGGDSYGAATHFFERDIPTHPRPTMPNMEYELAGKYGLTNKSQGITPIKKKTSPAKKRRR